MKFVALFAVKCKCVVVSAASYSLKLQLAFLCQNKKGLNYIIEWIKQLNNVTILIDKLLSKFLENIGEKSKKEAICDYFNTYHKWLYL
ncbi:hypothetical protein J19TS1_35190 [Heyndrickxia oleronia]|nr:hypothetical protein J19TS1_35190 [Heyndrickxia oleronia]